MKLTYQIYNKKLNMRIDNNIDDEYPDVFVTSDGRVGFVDTVGLFHEGIDWEVRNIEVKND